jgi:stearoyl-CoA desaturase (delta-9 desaturase)
MVLNTLKTLPFYAVHFLALSVFFLPWEPQWILPTLGFYFLRMFGITAGYHRYFSHRTYKMARVPQFLMALLGTLAVQKGVLWWAANHRHHHRYSDQPEDLHSPQQRGFWWSHIGWILSPKNEETRWELIKDISTYPELRFLNRFYLLPVILLGVTFYLTLGWSGFVWVFGVSTVLLWHGTFTINSLSHVYGRQRYRTGDTSRNNFWLALITLGEGWHNNHHCYQNSVRQGFYWWELDVSYLILKALSWLRITRDLKMPPLKLLEARRLNSITDPKKTEPLTHPGQGPFPQTQNSTRPHAAGPLLDEHFLTARHNNVVLELPQSQSFRWTTPGRGA